MVGVSKTDLGHDRLLTPRTRADDKQFRADACLFWASFESYIDGKCEPADTRQSASKGQSWMITLVRFTIAVQVAFSGFAISFVLYFSFDWTGKQPCMQNSLISAGGHTQMSPRLERAHRDQLQGCHFKLAARVVSRSKIASEGTGSRRARRKFHATQAIATAQTGQRLSVPLQ